MLLNLSPRIKALSRRRIRPQILMFRLCSHRDTPGNREENLRERPISRSKQNAEQDTVITLKASLLRTSVSNDLA
jgi:hypothetical protein